MLSADFFAHNALSVAQALLGKVIRKRYQQRFLSVKIIETEAYFLADKASHASLGFTEKRKALFMPPGTIYMYHSRAGASMNISCLGEGNAVLIKAGYPHLDDKSPDNMMAIMQQQQRQRNGLWRELNHLCSGPTLLCQALGLRIADWDQKNFVADQFFIDHVQYQPKAVIQTTRLGIPTGRDAHLPYRFVDLAYAHCCSRNPLRKGQIPGVDYYVLSNEPNPADIR